jgi:hypothetical protein
MKHLPKKNIYEMIFFYCVHVCFVMLFAKQKNTKTIPGQTSFYAELGVPGILFSVNIDRRFTNLPLGLGGVLGWGL